MDKLREKIIDALDPDDIIAILDLSTEELLYYLHDPIEECIDKFKFLEGPEDKA